MSVTGAIVGANSSTTASSLVTWETLAFTGVAIANALVTTLGVFVVVTLFIRRIYPGEFVGANSLRAVATVVCETKTPVIVAIANATRTASAVSGTSIVATSIHNGEECQTKGNQSNSRYHFISFNIIIFSPCFLKIKNNKWQLKEQKTEQGR